MKEPCNKGVANHVDPESCVGVREDPGEALTGAHAGPVLSRENKQFGTPTPLSEAEGNTHRGRYREPSIGPARSKTRSTYGNFLRENREILMSPAHDGGAGRVGKVKSQTPTTHGLGKSDRSVVPTKSSNKAGMPAAEAVEGRDLAKGNTAEQNAPRTQSRTSAPSALDRVREAARKDKKQHFTALLHHINEDRLHASFLSLKKDAAAGVDGVTWGQYSEQLESNLRDLHRRLHQGAYRAKPSRRVFIPKADGRQRPLGVASLEDKIVQRALVEVMNAIYEEDFLGFSYGFRPRRNQHNALDALAFGIKAKKVNYVLDADIRGFFDTIDHEWLIKFVEHRVRDQRVLRLIHKWLGAGVMERGEWVETEVGSPQGATVSPLLANIYLHYVLDLWVQQWRKRNASGEIIIIRYCDDFIVGFQHRDDAERFLAALRNRLAKFRLELHPDKTRLIAFGRLALSERRRREEKGSVETFDFLGFTHICGRARNGGFMLHRHTMRKRMTAKLHEVSAEMQRRRHQSITDQGRWLAAVLRGHYGYYAVPTNSSAIDAFRRTIARNWYRSLRRRSQRKRLDWKRMSRIIARWLPSARIVHPWPDSRFAVRTQGKSPVR